VFSLSYSLRILSLRQSRGGSKHNKTRPEKKKQYLEIMDQQNLTTFAATAEYIKQNIETDKKPSYDTIKRWLSQASKGDFS
jgi:transposase